MHKNNNRLLKIRKFNIELYERTSRLHYEKIIRMENWQYDQEFRCDTNEIEDNDG